MLKVAYSSLLFKKTEYIWSCIYMHCIYMHILHIYAVAYAYICSCIYMHYIYAVAYISILNLTLALEWLWTMPLAAIL